jgi:hypothetical protein
MMLNTYECNCAKLHKAFESDETQHGGPARNSAAPRTAAANSDATPAIEQQGL